MGPKARRRPAAAGGGAGRRGHGAAQAPPRVAVAKRAAPGKRVRSPSASPVRRRGKEPSQPGPWRKGCSEGQLQDGNYFEAELTSTEDLALFRAVAVHPAAATGARFVEVAFHGALKDGTNAELKAAFATEPPPLVHLCAAGEDCQGGHGGRRVVHVPRWRTRLPTQMGERQYHPLVSDLVGSEENFKDIPKPGLQARLRILKERLAAEHSGAPGAAAAPGRAAPPVPAARQSVVQGSTPPGDGGAARAATGSGTPSAILQERGRKFQEDLEERRKRKKRKKARSSRRRRRSSSTSSSRSSTSRSAAGFRQARTVGERNARAIATRPGSLMKNTLGEMRRFLVTGQGSTMGNEELTPIVRAYLTSVLLPSARGTMTARNESELKLLADATDRLLQGDYAGAGDLLLLRFQQVEMAHGDGCWKMARHLLPDAESMPSSTARSARSSLIQEEAKFSRLQALSGGTAGPSPTRGGQGRPIG